MKKTKDVSSNDSFKRILEAVEDYIFEHHRFPGITELTKRTGIPEKRVRENIRTLVGQDQLCIVYQAPSHPTLYARSYMMQTIQRTQAKPQWLSTYSFGERIGIEQKIEQARDELTKYDLLEGLLYRTGTPLEDSVECALKVIEFENVRRYLDQDNPDITFSADGKEYISDVKGKSKEADKDDIQQLKGWVEAEVEKGTEPESLVGLLFINHFRNAPPDQRQEFMSPHAKRFAKLGRIKVLTTFRLFQLVKQVMQGSLTKEKARGLIIEGENYG